MGSPYEMELNPCFFRPVVFPFFVVRHVYNARVRCRLPVRSSGHYVRPIEEQQSDGYAWRWSKSAGELQVCFHLFGTVGWGLAEVE